MTEWGMDPAFAVLAKQPRERLEDAHAVRSALASSRQAAQLNTHGFDLQIEHRYVPFLEHDDQQIPIRIYRPKNAERQLPVLLYLHGGGFFCGDVSSDEWQCAHYAHGAECAVVCVAYRLAPEHPFPAALRDCYRVLEFLWDESKNLRLNRDAIAIGGSSAGANLAAAVALMARDQGGPKIKFQMLLVPVLDERLETVSAQAFTDVPDFARPEAVTMWRWYLGNQVQHVSAYAAPARSTDLANLPRTYVLCAGLDPLRDEGLQFAHRLTDAGVAVELHLVPSIPHGFASVPSAAISQRLLAEQVDVLRSAFEIMKDVR